MAENRGVAPLDPTTDVGKLRSALGDTTYTELDPPEPGYGNYADYSDLELEAFIAQGGSVEGGASRAYMQMAGAAAREAKNIQDFDLKINTEKRAEYLMQLAGMWQDKADALSADIFEVFDLSGQDCCIPELTPRPICRRGCSSGGLF